MVVRAVVVLAMASHADIELIGRLGSDAWLNTVARATRAAWRRSDVRWFGIGLEDFSVREHDWDAAAHRYELRLDVDALDRRLRDNASRAERALSERGLREQGHLGALDLLPPRLAQLRPGDQPVG